MRLPTAARDARQAAAAAREAEAGETAAVRADAAAAIGAAVANVKATGSADRAARARQQADEAAREMLEEYDDEHFEWAVAALAGAQAARDQRLKKSPHILTLVG